MLELFPGTHRGAMAALRSGRLPSTDAVVLF
jgi:hypothetical protein